MNEFESARRRLEQSSTFQRSASLLSLLDFLETNAEESSPLKETYIGVAFYKRDADYDPRFDSIARVNVRRLRQKLELFYTTEGTAETARIEIPLGSFAPRVVSVSAMPPARSQPEALPPEEEWPEPSANGGPTSKISPAEVPVVAGTSRLAIRASGLAAVVVVALAIYLAARHWERPQPFPTGTWHALPLTPGRDLEFEPATTPDGKRLAYVSRSSPSGRFQIFQRAFRADSPVTRVLDTGPGDAFYPAWSPDTKTIAFLQCATGPCQIATVPADGGRVALVKVLPLYTLPDDQAYYQFRQVGPAWTADGRGLIFPYQAIGDTAERLVEQTLATGAVRQLTFGQPGDDDGAPAVSHDGRSVAFLRRQLDHTDVMVLNLRSGAARVLETEPSHSPSGVTWAHDDSGVVVGIVRQSSAPSLLWVPLQGAPRVLSVNLPGMLNPVFTGDGKTLMVLSANRNRNLAQVTGLGNKPELVFRTKQKNSFSALSPDSRRLAFLSDLSGRFEVWIAEREGGGFAPARQITRGMPYYPVSIAWAPDGRTLAVGISHTNQVEMVDVATEAFQALAVPGFAKSNFWSPAWSADGRAIFLAVHGEHNGIVRASATLVAGVETVMHGDAEELRLDGDRALYFTTGNRNGIYKLPLVPGATPSLVAPLAEVNPARDWFIDGSKLFYLDLHDSSRRLHTFDLLTGQMEVVGTPLIRPAFLDGSLSYSSRDGLLLYSEWSEEAGSQIFTLYPPGVDLEPK